VQSSSQTITSLLQDKCSSCRPTNSIKALNGNKVIHYNYNMCDNIYSNLLHVTYVTMTLTFNYLELKRPLQRHPHEQQHVVAPSSKFRKSAAMLKSVTHACYSP